MSQLAIIEANAIASTERETMLNDNEFQELVEDLSSTDVSIRVATLKTLCQEPSEDERVLPHIEALLNDTTLCVVMLPYRFAEIRWLAAKALVAERAAQGRSVPVRLLAVVQPLNTEEFASLASAAGVKSRGGVEGVLETLATLREIGQLPLYDLEFVPNIKNKQDKKNDDLASSNSAKSEEEVTQEAESSE